MNIDEAISSLREKFRPSLVDRAVDRLDDVTEIIQGEQWEVTGVPSMGDKFPSYAVEFEDDEHKYICECSTHQHGEHRRLCSHIVAVILWRRVNKTKNGLVGRLNESIRPIFRSDGGEKL